MARTRSATAERGSAKGRLGGPVRSWGASGRLRRRRGRRSVSVPRVGTRVGLRGRRHNGRPPARRGGANRVGPVEISVAPDSRDVIPAHGPHIACDRPGPSRRLTARCLRLVTPVPLTCRRFGAEWSVPAGTNAACLQAFYSGRESPACPGSTTKKRRAVRTIATWSLRGRRRTGRLSGERGRRPIRSAPRRWCWATGIYSSGWKGAGDPEDSDRDRQGVRPFCSATRSESPPAPAANGDLEAGHSRRDS